MNRISKAIDNHPHHTSGDSNDVAGGGGGGISVGGVVPDAIWSLGASLSSYVFGAGASTVGIGGGGTKLDSREVRESSSSLLEPPNTDELVDELSKIVARHRPKDLPSCLVKIAFFGEFYVLLSLLSKSEKRTRERETRRD